jgi:hypothetical protein
MENKTEFFRTGRDCKIRQSEGIVILKPVRDSVLFFENPRITGGKRRENAQDK